MNRDTEASTARWLSRRPMEAKREEVTASTYEWPFSVL